MKHVSIILWGFLLAASAFCSEDMSLKKITEIESQTEALIESSLGTSIDREARTPLSAILNIRNALIDRNWAAATKYIDTRYLPEDVVALGDEELVRRLTLVWQQQKLIDYTTLSDVPEGHVDDNLPVYRDLVGNLQTSQGVVPVYLQRVPDGNGGKVWKISNATLSKVPLLWGEFGYHPRIDALAKYLPNFSLLNMENWQFVALIILLFATFVGALVLTWLLSFLCVGEVFGPIAKRFVRRNIRWVVFFMVVSYGVGQLGLSLKAKAWFASGLFDYLAYLFLLLGVVEIFTAVLLIRNQNSKNTVGVAIVRPLATTLKILLVLVVMLTWLSDAGYSIATLLTGLGIGSLAVALAAQKTLENVFGAFTLYVARPIKPGDFCAFGDVTGTVEEIGLRSTRIRTLERKVVHIPNSEFSAKNLVNISEIDRRLYKQPLRIHLSTSADELRQLLIALREMVWGHEKILENARRVRFERIDPDAYIIVINAYIAAASLADYKAVVEDLNLHVLRILQHLELALAPPQQAVTVYQGVDNRNAENAEVAAKDIDSLRQQQRLPFPDFDAQTEQELKDTLKWPPEGSSGYHTALTS